MAADRAAIGATAAMQVVDVAVEAAEFPEHPNPHLKVALILDARGLDVAWVSATGRAMRGRVARGTSSVMPADMPYATHWRGAGRMLLLSFSEAFLGAHDQALGRAARELSPAWSQPDPLLLNLGLSVLAAQGLPWVPPSYLDAAAEVALVHLTSRHGTVRPPSRPEPLVRPRLAKVLDLIEAQLGEALPLARLADAAGLSVHGFARAFNQAVGQPPHRYILARRCARAQALLAGSALPIADIASAVGFSSQAHLTTALLRLAGVTPARYRAGQRR